MVKVSARFSKKKNSERATRFNKEVETAKSISRLVKIYCSFQYKIEQSTMPNSLMVDAIRSLFEKLKEADKEMCFLPFDREDEDEKVLQETSDLPNDIGSYRKYLPNMFPNYQGGAIFTKDSYGLEYPV